MESITAGAYEATHTFRLVRVSTEVQRAGNCPLPHPAAPAPTLPSATCVASACWSLVMAACRTRLLVGYGNTCEHTRRIPADVSMNMLAHHRTGVIVVGNNIRPVGAVFLRQVGQLHRDQIKEPNNH